MTIIAILAAVLAVAAIIYLIIRLSQTRKEAEETEAGLRAKLEELQSHASELNAEKSRLESKLESSKDFIDQLEKSHEAAMKAQKESLAEAAQTQKEMHDKEMASLKDAFKALSAENSEAFKQRSAESISELLKPIREKFEEFDKTVKESQKESLEQSAQLKEHIRGVMERSQAVGDEARNLANALTGYSKVQGDFGEMLLADVLKNAGFVEGIHFRTQGVITDNDGRVVRTEEGKTMIPDVMVYYPDDTIVIVDSKVSLKAYKEFMTAETPEDQKRWAKEHVASVSKHVDELKNKDYASYIPQGKRKVNYNIMFIPMEGAFRLMLEQDPMLWQIAKDNNVLIVSQMTLVIVLNMIQMAWKQANQEKNIAEVYKTAGELMSQLKGWMDAYVGVGEALDKAVKSYDISKKKLTESNQSVMKKIVKLQNLELSPAKSKASVSGVSRRKAAGSFIPPQLSPEDSSDDEEN